MAVSCPHRRRRHPGVMLHHLQACVAPTAATSARSSGGSTSRTADHLARLARDGVTVVEDAFTPAEVAEIRVALRVACAEVRAALPSVSWTEMHYQPQLVQSPSFCTVRALYEGKSSAGYEGTEIIDLTRGRYDFCGGIVKEQPVLATAWMAPMLTAIARAELKVGWGPVG